MISLQFRKLGYLAGTETTNSNATMEPDLLKSSLFYTDQRLCSAEILSPSEVFFDPFLSSISSSPIRFPALESQPYLFPGLSSD